MRFFLAKNARVLELTFRARTFSIKKKIQTKSRRMALLEKIRIKPIKISGGGFFFEKIIGHLAHLF
jgi:hypothetical protein